MAFEPCDVPITRWNEGRPILAPRGDGWEGGVTFNASALLLDRSPKHDAILRRLLGSEALNDPRLANGVVAVHYRARPRRDPGFPMNRSYIGLALFTSRLELLERFSEPVLRPEEAPDAYDTLGVEDPRITPIDDAFVAVYCGVARDEPSGWRARVCFARSTDLLTWEKLGPVDGSLNAVNNKDGVLFPERIDGRYLLLHRPMVGPQSDWAIALASSDSLTGHWTDHGTVLRATPDPRVRESWVGAGSVPIPLGEGRYLVLYHTGHRFDDGDRLYTTDATIFDLSRFDSTDPTRIVTARLERLLVPETEWERRAPFSDSVANVVFLCGSYELGDEIVLVYGGGDTYILAASVRREALLDALESA